MHVRPIARTLLFSAAVLAAAAGCATTTTTETGGAGGNPSGSGSTAPSLPPKTTAPSGKAQCTPAYDPDHPTTIAPFDCGSGTGLGGTTTHPNLPPTTCVAAPASTAPGVKGGGELICSSPGDDGSVSSPPMTDTTIPGPGPSIAQPDATHGALTIVTGGSPCPKSAEACVAMFQVVPAKIHLENVGSAATVDGETSGREGMLSLQLEPGTWRITATPIEGDRTCTGQEVMINAGETTSISVDCALPG